MSIEWLTYAEAAKLLNIKPDSAKKRAMRRHWPRLVGNDGKTRIQVPPECLGTVITDITPDIPEDTSPPHNDIRERLAAAETEVRLLRERLDDLTADRDALRDALTQAASQAQTVRRVGGFWSRLFDRS